MKIKVPLLLGTVQCLSVLPANAVTVALSGTVYDAAGSGKAGVAVSLSGTTLTATTDASGAWSLLEDATGIASRSSSVSIQPRRHLIVEGDRFHLSFFGYDLMGHPLQYSISGQAPITMKMIMARSITVPDTLLYSWNGTVFLRDTVSVSLRSGIVATFDTTLNASIIYGWLNDARDNQIYRTVKIGTQVWMAENMKYSGIDNNSLGISNGIYGRLYTWTEVMDIASIYLQKYWGGSLPTKGICPSDWHVPSNNEWLDLITFAGNRNAANRLKSMTGWENSGNGTDNYGFRALPSGTIYSANYGYRGWWWSSSSDMLAPTSAHCRVMEYDSSNVFGYYNYVKTGRFALRCVHD